MGAQPSHSLGLPSDTGASCLVQALGLDEGEGDFSVEEGVVGQVDLLLATLAQEALYLVAATGEGVGLGYRQNSCRGFDRDCLLRGKRRGR